MYQDGTAVGGVVWECFGGGVWDDIRPCILSNSILHSSHPAAPATPMAPHLPPAQTQLPVQHLGFQTTTGVHVSTVTNGLSIYQRPHSPQNSCHSYKKDPIMPSLPSTPD